MIEFLSFSLCRLLADGTLEDNFLVDGSRITLLPRAETGLLVRKKESLLSHVDNKTVDIFSPPFPYFSRESVNGVDKKARLSFRKVHLS